MASILTLLLMKLLTRLLTKLLTILLSRLLMRKLMRLLIRLLMRLWNILQQRLLVLRPFPLLVPVPLMVPGLRMGHLASAPTAYFNVVQHPSAFRKRSYVYMATGFAFVADQRVRVRELLHALRLHLAVHKLARLILHAFEARQLVEPERIFIGWLETRRDKAVEGVGVGGETIE